MALKHQDVNNATAVYADKKLLLFVQLKSAVTEALFYECNNRVTVTDSFKRRSTVETSSAAVPNDTEDNGSSVHDFGIFRGFHTLAWNKLESEIRLLIDHWLPSHCRPDKIVLVSSVPFTRHGQTPFATFTFTGIT